MIRCISDQKDDKGLLSYIATSVETMRDQIATLQDQMVTKDDLAQMATKNDLRQVELRLSTEIQALRGDIEHAQLRLNTIELTCSPATRPSA